MNVGNYDYEENEENENNSILSKEEKIQLIKIGNS